MQTLPAGIISSLDSTSRSPSARVFLRQGYDSLPFAGKLVQNTDTDEKYAKHIIHSTGRYCLVYSKYADYVSYTCYDLYFKCSNDSKLLWETPVKLAAGAYLVNFLNPTLVELANGNIGVVVNRAGTLYSMVIDKEGAIVTALATLGITGVTPSLSKVGSTYWLAYEASGILYYRTSADFITWSAATNINTITGLTNNHSAPYLYYGLSSKFWLGFERVTDASVSPEIVNTYYMISTNGGVSWDAPVLMTNYGIGEGFGRTPSIVDTGDDRYFSFIYKRTISNYNYGGYQASNSFFNYDEDNERVIFYSTVRTGGGTVTERNLVLYDEETQVYTTHNLLSRGFTSSVEVSGVSYSDGIFAIASDQGLLVYNESLSTWKLYTTTSTPAIPNNSVRAVRVHENKVYYSCNSSTGTRNHQYLNTSTDEITAIGAPNFTWGGAVYYGDAIYLTDLYVVFFTRRSVTPYFTVYSLTDYAKLHESTITKTGYVTYHSNSYIVWSTQNEVLPAVDEENNIIWFWLESGTNPKEKGIGKFQITDVAITEMDYWDNLPSNAVGILPNPDGTNNKISAIVNMTYKNDRLVLFSQTSIGTSDLSSEMFITVINTLADAAIAYFGWTTSDDYAALFPEIDSQVEKILLLQFAKISAGYGYHPILNESDILSFRSWGGYSAGDYWHQLAIDGESSRAYYRETSDDITWSSASYLTQGASDDYIQLGFNGTNLVAFWNAPLEGVHHLKWEEYLLGEINLSEFVESIEISKSLDAAYQCSIVLADKEGRFDPLNYNSLQYNYLEENNIIRVEKGNSGVYVPSFLGHIGAGYSNRIRGEQIFYKIDVFDKSKPFLQRKITTHFYENQTVLAILTSIVTTYMELSVGEYVLPSITTTIPTVQFIDEYPMDILKKLLEPYFYFPYFDEEGILRAKEINYDAVTDFTYYKDNTDTASAVKAPAMNLVSFDYEWTDKELVNRVIVIGETAETTEKEFEEEYMGSIQGAAGWFSKKNSFTFYFSQDKSLYCTNPRLKVQDSCGSRFFGGGQSLSSPGAGKQLYCRVTQKTTYLVNALYFLIGAALACVVLYAFGKGMSVIVNPLAFVVATAISLLGQVSNFYYEIYAQPVGDAVPETIIVQADDADLQARYGVVEKEIDNPFLNTYELCNLLAHHELDKAKWFRYIPHITILDNPGIQVGDVILFYNPFTDNKYKIYITSIEQSYKRGERDIANLQGALIT